jgi:hypothetical protein
VIGAERFLPVALSPAHFLTEGVVEDSRIGLAVVPDLTAIVAAESALASHGPDP